MAALGSIDQFLVRAPGALLLIQGKHQGRVHRECALSLLTSRSSNPTPPATSPDKFRTAVAGRKRGRGEGGTRSYHNARQGRAEFIFNMCCHSGVRAPL